jgi:hypothetical protein
MPRGEIILTGKVSAPYAELTREVACQSEGTDEKRKTQLMRSSVVCIALLVTSLFAKDPTEWKQGELLNLDIASQSRIGSVNGIIGTVVRSVFTYTVDGGDRVYDGREIGRRNATPIHVEVNAPVQYAVDKDHLYIKDSDGKSHKLGLIQTTRKE